MQLNTFALFATLMSSVLASLPPTFQLRVSQNGQILGCLDGDGAFITDTSSCYTFTSKAIGSNPEGPQTVTGSQPCATSTGILLCNQAGVRGAAFIMTGLDLELVGSGTQFSSNGIPAASERAAVRVGFGSTVQFSLQVQSL